MSCERDLVLSVSISFSSHTPLPLLPCIWYALSLPGRKRTSSFRLNHHYVNTHQWINCGFLVTTECFPFQLKFKRDQSMPKLHTGVAPNRNNSKSYTGLSQSSPSFHKWVHPGFRNQRCICRWVWLVLGFILFTTVPQHWKTKPSFRDHATSLGLRAPSPGWPGRPGEEAQPGYPHRPRGREGQLRPRFHHSQSGGQRRRTLWRAERGQRRGTGETRGPTDEGARSPRRLARRWRARAWARARWGGPGIAAARKPLGRGRVPVLPFASVVLSRSSRCMCGNNMSAPLPAIVPAARKATAAVSGGGWEGSEGSARPAAGHCPSLGVGIAGRLATGVWGRSDLLGSDWGWGGWPTPVGPQLYGESAGVAAGAWRPVPNTPTPARSPSLLHCGANAARGVPGPPAAQPQLGGTGVGVETQTRGGFIACFCLVCGCGKSYVRKKMTIFLPCTLVRN